MSIRNLLRSSVPNCLVLTLLYLPSVPHRGIIRLCAISISHGSAVRIAAPRC